jgi:hypothetical protein
MDETSSFYVDRDGNTDIVVYQDRVISKGKDAAERDKDEKEWKDGITAGTSDVHRHLKECGATGIQSLLLRDKRPYAWALSAHLGSVEALAKYFDMGSDGGSVHLEKNGTTRRLVFTVVDDAKKKKDKKKAPKKEREPYPAIRIIPTEGTVTGVQGFVRGPGGDFAVADLQAIDRMDSKGGKYEIWVEWKLP